MCSACALRTARPPAWSRRSAQNPSTQDGLSGRTALPDMVAAELAVDDLDLQAVDGEDAAALFDAGDLDPRLARHRAQVPDQAVRGDGRSPSARADASCRSAIRLEPSL